ncbi:MAG: adenylate/guanylate cyclase domain-containing protein [Acidobacteriota bacterium]
MSEEQQQDVAVLFVDVSGSTKLYDTAGDAVAVAAIDTCIALFRSKTGEHRGRVIKTIGDEVMSVFPTAGDATEAAIEIQLAIEELPPVAGTKLGVRIGFHAGPVVARDDGDVFGDTVNLAARLTGLATKGQIITSRESADRLPPMLKSACRQLYSIPVKGKANEVMLCDVFWQQSEEATQMAGSRTVMAPPKETTLTLRYHGKEIVLTGDKNSVTLGRDPAADFVIQDRMASRSHCKIERRRNKFALIDHSANGTFLQVGDERETMLRREEIVLRNSGVIAFGQSCASTKELVEFKYE